MDADEVDFTGRLERRAVDALVDEFEGRRSAGEILAWADVVLARYDEVPVRLHILTLAHRRTRECLRKDACDVLAAV